MTLPLGHYSQAKPTSHRPEHWRVSMGIGCAQASVWSYIPKKICPPICFGPRVSNIGPTSHVSRWWCGTACAAAAHHVVGHRLIFSTVHSALLKEVACKVCTTSKSSAAVYIFGWWQSSSRVQRIMWALLPPWRVNPLLHKGILILRKRTEIKQIFLN